MDKSEPNSRALGLSHDLSRRIGASYDIPHGLTSVRALITLYIGGMSDSFSVSHPCSCGGTKGRNGL
jgi:hypothetical protein